MWHRSMMLAILLLGLAISIKARTCMPDAVPENQRSNITVGGLSMPLVVWYPQWASGHTSAYVFSILAGDVLGYHMSEDSGSSSQEMFFALGGCLDPPAFATDPKCGTGVPVTKHVGFENWETQNTLLPGWLAQVGAMAPVLMGNIGYDGLEGMYIMDKALSAALSDTGLHLEFYGSYNSSWYNPKIYFPNITTIDLSFMQTCSADRMSSSQDAYIYVHATGDYDGVINASGQLKLKCWNDVWWLSPACRNTPESCIPVVSTGDAWGFRQIIQQISFHNMPMAFGTAINTSMWKSINVANKGALYAFEPDVTFLALGSNAGEYELSKIGFPLNNAREYIQKIYKTAFGNTILSNWYFKDLKTVADRAHFLLSKYKLSQDEINGMLGDVGSVGDDDYWAGACRWVIENRMLWSAWIPDSTTCSEGKGLVDSAGNLLESRLQAVDCKVCPVGRASTPMMDGTGPTRFCLQCPRGESQELPGEQACVPCYIGSYSAVPGSMACTLCAVGSYGNLKGLSACSVCGQGTVSEKLRSTSRAIMVQGEEERVAYQGAVSFDACGCVKGARMDASGECVLCGEGLKCDGSGKVMVLEGFYTAADSPGSVFKCYGDAKRCPGGPPGTCAHGRDNETVACSSCESGLRPGGDGICTPCSSGNSALFSVAIILIILAIAILYISLKSEGQDSKSQNASLLVLIVAVGQCVTVWQVLGVFGQLKISWGSPFSKVLDFVSLFAFNIEWLNVSCVASFSPGGMYAARVFLVLFLFVVACCIHFVYVALRKKFADGLEISALVKVTGNILMIFFIPVAGAILAPFRCYKHPNGLHTVQEFGGVLCNSQGEHQRMLIIAGIALILPVSFLAIASYVVIVELPKRMQKADVAFLRTCSFLYYRFRPGAAVFSVIILLRNVVLVIVPAIPGGSAQVLLFMLVLCLSILVTSFMLPWRILECNYLEASLLAGMAVCISMGSLFLEDVDVDSVMQFCLGLFTAMILLISGVLVWGFTKFLRAKYRKPFQYFLCHHKTGAGAFARLLKCELSRMNAVKAKVFVDCDDLQDLTQLFGYVGFETEHLIILGTKDILTRKWCMGEVTTGRLHKINTVVVALPNYEPPSETLVQEYQVHVPDVTELAAHGISLAAVQETLRWMRELPRIELLGTLDSTLTRSLCKELVVMRVSPGSMVKNSVQLGCEAEDEPDKEARLANRMIQYNGSKVAILVDYKNMEAVATALVLQLMVSPLLMSVGGMVPYIMAADEEAMPTVRILVVICSQGCFANPEIAKVLLSSAALSFTVLPIIAEDSFRIPTKDFYDEALASAGTTSMSRKLSRAAVIKQIFQEIAVAFQPQGYSASVQDLEVKAKTIAFRLLGGKLRPMSLEDDQPTSPEELEAKSLGLLPPTEVMLPATAEESTLEMETMSAEANQRVLFASERSARLKSVVVNPFGS
ncbi:unnamed protein product [Polarella glacialis]|uniref:Tyrosine-protein kinase ephrin type A/B receptor-like domain-containing protein n=1 Tax=Polarella glacialis TaxID=89957 RepID=A0A813E0G7_POLGL|nr:unnamed protein product [Polarella glacialis]